MTFNVLSVQPETSLETAVKILRRHRIGSLPVIKNGKVVGILTRSDVLDFALSRKSLKQSYRRKSREKVVKIRRS
jgi:CBS domain-containing protein